jgi:hypothetical protein
MGAVGVEKLPVAGFAQKKADIFVAKILITCGIIYQTKTRGLL